MGDGEGDLTGESEKDLLSNEVLEGEAGESFGDLGDWDGDEELSLVFSGDISCGVSDLGVLEDDGLGDDLSLDCLVDMGSAVMAGDLGLPDLCLLGVDLEGLGWLGEGDCLLG